jgi:hypothetical protein
MNLKTKESCEYDYIDIFPHQVCVILNVKKQNVLYNFKDGDKLLRDLRSYLDTEQIIYVKEFLELNAPKMKFTDNPIEPTQLSLF